MHKKLLQGQRLWQKEGWVTREGTKLTSKYPKHEPICANVPGWGGEDLLQIGPSPCFP